MTKNTARAFLKAKEQAVRSYKRDMFACAALTGMLASAPMVDRTKLNKLTWAKIAYQFADAMLKARK